MKQDIPQMGKPRSLGSIRDIALHAADAKSNASENGYGEGVRWEKIRSSKGEMVGGKLPICPYGCGRQGTLLEIVMTEDGRAIGIFNDHPCTCVFCADVEIGEPPTKRKMVIGPDGEYHLEGGDKP